MRHFFLRFCQVHYSECLVSLLPSIRNILNGLHLQTGTDTRMRHTGPPGKQTMQKSMTYRIIRDGFWLSLLLHFLLFLSICTVVTLQPEEETPHKSPHYFVPSYMYTGSIKPTVQQHNSTGTQSNPLPDNASLAQNTENTPPSRSKAETETDQGAVNMANAASTQGTL